MKAVTKYRLFRMGLFYNRFLDTRHDGRSALELFINAYGIVGDGWGNDATGREDFSPDLFWETAGKIDERGWTVEARLPFSSLRYRTSDGQTKMGIIFYRNYPREYRFQMFSVPLPRNANCFVCRSTTLTGFTGLPLGHHLVVAPYGSVSVLGSQQPDGSWRDGPTVGRGGADIKWVPNADTAVDLALNPDFSQVESDTAQLTVNQRFALFYDEKRPFFLEGADLFDTPVQAVYTRTITEPRWGARATGKVGRTTYTALVADDRGGGSVIIPGPQASDLAPSDFETVTGIARARSDFGRSYAGLLATVRRNDDDVGSGNRVIGPDFQWRPSDAAQLTAQYLYSQSQGGRHQI